MHPARLTLRNCIVRELAHIERGLRGAVRQIDLLYAFKQYLGHNEITVEDKRLARDALRYYRDRRQTRKRRQRALRTDS